jgi:hypothetical protein
MILNIVGNRCWNIQGVKVEDNEQLCSGLMMTCVIS